MITINWLTRDGEEDYSFDPNSPEGQNAIARAREVTSETREEFVNTRNSADGQWYREYDNSVELLRAVEK